MRTGYKLLVSLVLVFAFLSAIAQSFGIDGSEGGVLPLMAGFSVSSNPSSCNGAQISLYSNDTSVGPLYPLFSLAYQTPGNIYIGSTIDTFYQTIYTYMPIVPQPRSRVGKGGWLIGMQVEMEQYYLDPTKYYWTGGVLTSPFVSTIQPFAIVYEPNSETIWAVAQLGREGVVCSIDPIQGNFTVLYNIPQGVPLLNPTPAVVNPISNTFSFLLASSPTGYLFTISTLDPQVVSQKPVHYHNSSSIALCGLANWEVDPKTGKTYALCSDDNSKAYWLSELDLDSVTYTTIGNEPLVASSEYLFDYSFALNWKDKIAYALENPKSTTLLSANYETGKLLPSMDVSGTSSEWVQYIPWLHWQNVTLDT